MSGKLQKPLGRQREKSGVASLAPTDFPRRRFSSLFLTLFFFFSILIFSIRQVLKALVAVGVPTSEEDIKPVEVLISEVSNRD